MIGSNTYKGQFLNGKKSGIGKLYYGDGSFYEGMFEDNTIHGEGKYYSKNNYWEGSWKNGYMEGKGKQLIAKNELRNQEDVQSALKNRETSIYVG